MPVTVKCPTCSRVVLWLPESAYRPFCSERCRLIDLGEWASEGYSVPEDPTELEGPDLRNESSSAGSTHLPYDLITHSKNR